MQLFSPHDIQKSKIFYLTGMTLSSLLSYNVTFYASYLEGFSYKDPLIAIVSTQVISCPYGFLDVNQTSCHTCILAEIS